MNMNISPLTHTDASHGVKCKATVQSERDERLYYEVVSQKGWSCTCPHHTFRHVTCKHIRAVKEQLKELKHVER